jgi:hypothetical protein
MTINNEQKQKLRKILDDISTPEERADLAKQDKLENIQNSVKDVGSFGKALEGIKDFFNQRIDRVENKVKNIKPTDLSPLLEVLTETKNILSKPQKQQDMSGFFKDLGTQLVQFGTSTKNTEEIIRNLKWNSTMGIKNRNGSPIDPATDGIGIGSFDEVDITNDGSGNPTIMVYKYQGATVATLNATYDGSGNITKLTRV